MRIFFIKAFTFVIGISLIFNVLGTMADSVAPLEVWRVAHQERVDTLEAKRNQLEAITLGNSHSDAVDFSVLGIDGQSLAFAAADLFEVEKYAAYLDDRLPNLKTVFIAISYYSFSRDNATFEPFRTLRIKYYSVVPAWSPIHGDTSNLLLGKLESYTHVMSVVRSDSWEEVWKGMVNDTPSENPSPFDGVITTSEWGICSHYTAEQLESHASDIANRNVISSNQMATIHQGLGQDASAALARTIERLQSKGIRVVLFTPSYHERYNTYFMEDGFPIYEDMRSRMEELQQSYSVEYYDFSADLEITIHPELFYNSDHLGDCGSRIFSAKLLNAMNGSSE